MASDGTKEALREAPQGKGNIMKRENTYISKKEAVASMLIATTAAFMIFTATASADEIDANIDVNDSVGITLAEENAPAAPEAIAETAPAADEALTPAGEVAASETVTEDASGNEVAEAEGVYVIEQSGEYTVSGTGTTSVTVRGEGVVATLNMVDANIDATGTGNSAVSISDHAQVIMNIIGNCSFIGDENQAGIQVDETASLTIEGTGSASTLTAVGNAGVDYSTVADGKAAGNSNGAGIGGTKASPNAGTIVIDGNDRNLTVSAIGGGIGAAGIGSSYGGSASSITITGTVLHTVHGGCQNASLEGDDTYAKKTLEGGAGIGGGSKGASGGTVIIENSIGTDIVGGGKAAGIGGGCWATNVVVNIFASNLDVTGGTSGAGIGLGRAESTNSYIVNIADSIVTARGGWGGAGIGNGVNGSNRDLKVSDIYISGSTVTAFGGTGAAGIGGGIRGYNANVTIVDGSDVTAYAGANYRAKYTELHNGAADTVTEDGTIGQAGAAGIGRGAWGSVTKFTSIEDATLVISADSKVLAFSDGDNWAVAGFVNTDDVEASLMELRFSRNYDQKMNGTSADFITRSADEADLENEAFFIDGIRSTVLQVRDADTLQTVYTIVTPQVDEAFATGYAGTGRIGYYSVAMTLPAGEYKIVTESDLRTLDRLGDELVGIDHEGYLGGATHRNDAERDDIFGIAAGLNAFDNIAFRTAADEVPVIAPASDEIPTPVVIPTTDPTPAPRTAPVPASGVVTIVDAESPLAGTPAPAAGMTETVIADESTPLAAAPEVIADDAAPLAQAAGDHFIMRSDYERNDNWIAWLVAAGAALAAAFGIAAASRRRNRAQENGETAENF